MHIRPNNHRTAYQFGTVPDGYSAAAGPELTVEQEDDGAGVMLILDPLPGETLEDRQIDRLLTSPEARELAAMLWHHAEEADRRLGLR